MLLLLLLYSLLRTFGSLDAERISTDMQLIEYRGLFEHINTKGAQEISALARESSDFDYCYKYFVAAQGKMVSDDFAARSVAFE